MENKMYQLLREYKSLNKGSKNYLKNKDNLLNNGWILEIDLGSSRALFSCSVKEKK